MSAPDPTPAEPRVRATSWELANAVTDLRARIKNLESLRAEEFVAGVRESVAAELQPLRDEVTAIRRDLDALARLTRDRADAQQDAIDGLREDLAALRDHTTSNQNWISEWGEKLPKMKTSIRGLQIEAGKLRKRLGGAEDGDDAGTT